MTKRFKLAHVVFALSIAICFALTFSAAPAAASITPGKCVQFPHPVSLGSLTADDQVGAVEDIGNLTVMELSGEYDIDLDAPRQQVAKHFFANHPDQFDYLVVFSTFEFPTKDATAFYTPVRNDVAGIGEEPFDVGVSFSSPAELHGYIDMATLQRYTFVQDAPGYQQTLDVLAHEMMHRWGAYVHFIDATGNDSSDLLGLDAAHWSYFLDSDASVQYGNDWQLQTSGEFRSVDVRHRFSMLDLYLAGLASPSEIPPFTLIRNGTGGVSTDLPKLGAVSDGVAENVSIDQVIAASGPRIPSFADSQKEFSAAFILLKRPGESISADTVLQLEKFRVRFQQQFVEMTGGRGVMRIFIPGAASNAASLPIVLPGSGPTTHPVGVNGAIAWLESKQLPDGHWEDRSATGIRDTVAAMRTLSVLDAGFTGLQSARTWLLASTPKNQDELAWRSIDIDSGASDSSSLKQGQAKNGGFAILPTWIDSTFDTTLAASSLVTNGANDSVLDSTLARVAALQNPDGSFGVVVQGRGRIIPTLRAAAALGGHAAGSDLDQSRYKASDWVSTQLTSGGGLGDTGQTSIIDSVEAYLLVGRMPFGETLISAIRIFVTQNQQIAGDWEGSVYTTAVAALAVALDQRVNLAFASAPVVEPALPRDGEVAVFHIVVINSGNVPSQDSVLRLFDGDPSAGGAQIAADVLLPALAAGSRVETTARWDTTNRAGVHTIWFVLDPDNRIQEASELDNSAQLILTIATPAALADLVVDAADFSLTPSPVLSLPSHERLVGIVRNIGSQQATGTIFRVSGSAQGQPTLAQTSVDVPARGEAAIALGFDIQSAGNLELTLAADPDNLIQEVSKTNNIGKLVLPFGESVDLEVTAADIKLLTAQATAGQNLSFAATIHNRGTVDSPPATFHAEILQGQAVSVIANDLVTVPAGQSIVKTLVWRAENLGASALTVGVDPANQISETREDNNSAQLSFVVVAPSQPDLTFVSNSFEFNPQTGLEGQPLTATLMVRNLSSAPTTTFRVALYSADPVSGALPIASSMVSTLAGSSADLVSMTVPDLNLSAATTMYAFIDVDDAISEMDETNNLAIQTLQVRSLPDLSANSTDINLLPQQPVLAEPVTGNISVHNIGGQDAHGIVVRLYEGTAATGATVGADQTIDTLAAGTSSTLSWNWIFGKSPGAKSVTVVIDPAHSVRESKLDNNTATLALDLQNADYFASERYISPNGDGVQDSTAMVFVSNSSAPLTVQILNGAQYAVRSFTNVAVGANMRAQLDWDGRDDSARIVPDGDYSAVAIDQQQHRIGPVPITVDNNRSSILEAVDTAYGIYSPLPQNIYDMQIPPANSPLSGDLFGIWDSSQDGIGLSRFDTLSAVSTPILSDNWLKSFAAGQTISSASPNEFTFGGDGNSIIAGIVGNKQGHYITWIFTSDLEAIDFPQLRATVQDVVSPAIFGLFDANTLAVGPALDGSLLSVDLDTGLSSSIRDMTGLPGYDHAKVLPTGIYLYDDDLTYGGSTAVFIPRNSAQPQIDFQSLNGDPGQTSYAFQSFLSGSADKVFVYERDLLVEKVDAVDLATGIRSNLLRATTNVAKGDKSSVVIPVARFQVGWLDAESELFVQDAVAHSIFRFSASGEQISQIAFPAVSRIGPYVLPGGAASTAKAVFPAIPLNAVSSTCDARVGDPKLGLQRHIFDPTTSEFFVRFGERIAEDAFNSSDNYWDLAVADGVVEYSRANRETAAITSVEKGSLTALATPADSAQYPLLQSCVDAPPADWPALILNDGAKIRSDGRVQTLSRGLAPKRWADIDQLVDIWPDDTKVLLSQQTFSSLLNLVAVIQANSEGRGIQISGIAADRNFAYYKLDWAPVEHPENWQVALPPSSDQVFLDTFLNWVPPQAGAFVLRLTVVDKAGNSATAFATASSFDVAAIDSFSLSSRFFSPNGDGQRDIVTANFNVRQPTTVQIRISDFAGNLVRSADISFDSAMLGAQHFDWDGRDDFGHLLPDGKYIVAVDGISASESLDTVAPAIGGSLIQAYAQPPDAPACLDNSLPCLSGIRVEPAVNFAMFDTNTDQFWLQRASIGSQEWTSVEQLTSPQINALADVSNARLWAQLKIPLDEFNDGQYRLLSTDAAGNATTLLLGSAREFLPMTSLIHVGSDQVRGPPVGFHYQPEPFSTAPNIQGQVPAYLEADASNLLVAWDAAGTLAKVATETAPIDAPSRWTERGNFDLGDVSCKAGDCLPGQPNQLQVPLDASVLPLGYAAVLRLHGIKTDGSSIYSNQAFVQVGGIAKPACTANVIDVSTNVQIIANEYFVGPLSSATLHYVISGVEQTLAAGPGDISDDSIKFLAPAATALAWITGTDSRGASHQSEKTQLNCVDSSITESKWKIGLAATPAISDQCSGQPSNKIKLDLAVADPSETLNLHGLHNMSGLDPDAIHILVSVESGVSVNPIVLLDSDIDFNSLSTVSQTFELSTENWAEGVYAATVTTTNKDKTTNSFALALPVAKQPPRVSILTPADGQRVCAAPGTNGALTLSPTGIIDSPGDSAYRIELGAGRSPLSFQCMATSGESPAASPKGCPDYSAITGLTGRSVVGALQSFSNDDLRLYNGLATIRLKGVNWSGGTMCSSATVYLDSDTEFNERLPATTILGEDRGLIGLAPAGDPVFSNARIFLNGNEPLTFTAEVHHATIDAVTNAVMPDSAVAAIIVGPEQVQGSIDLVWNGQIGGQVAADGYYSVFAIASDGCQHTKTIRYDVLLDNSPPMVNLVSPASGDLVDAPTKQVLGSVTDRNLKSWLLDSALDLSPNSWQTIAQGSSEVPVASVLSLWSRGSFNGGVTFRLSAIDALGNHAEVRTHVLLGQTTKLIQNVDVQPSLISPNADGVADTARIQIGMLQAASLRASILDPHGTEIALLYSGSVLAGNQVFKWSGTDSAGKVQVDGDYHLAIKAVATDGSETTETADLTVSVDTTAPAAIIQTPSNGFISSNSAYRFQLSDAHFSGYELAISRTSDGNVVQSAKDSRQGDIAIPLLPDLLEDSYVMHLNASDAAGNASKQNVAFVLDNTFPIVEIVAPVENSIVPAGARSSIVATIDDKNLSGYTLAIAREGDDAWVEIANGDSNRSDEQILSWLPSLPDGLYRLRLRGVDKAGNTSDTLRTVAIDGTAPIAHIDSPVDQATVKGTLDVSGSASDEHFLAYRLSLLDASKLSSNQWTVLYTGNRAVSEGKLASVSLDVPQGNYELRLEVTDLAGLTTLDQVQVRVDSMPPPVPTGLTGLVANNRDAILDWSSVTADDLAGYNVYRNGVKVGTTNQATVHYVDQNAPEARLQYSITSFDLAGNESIPGNSVTLTVDHTPPDVAILRPQDGERIKGVYAIVGTAFSSADFDHYQMVATPLAGVASQLANSFLAAQAKTLSQFNTLAFTDETQIRIHLEAFDTHANKASIDRDVVVDNQAPAPPTGLSVALTGADATVRWDANSESDLLGYLLYRDEVPVNSSTDYLPADLRALALTTTLYTDGMVPDGQHNYILYAIDRAGNISGPSQPSSLPVIDNEAPSLTIVAPLAGARFEKTLTIVAKARDSDIAQVQFSFRPAGTSQWTDLSPALDDTPFTVKWTPVVGTPFGDYDIRGLARDNGGRVDPAPPMVRVTYADLTAPDAPRNVIARANGDTVDLTWTASSASDLAGYRIYRNTRLVSDLAVGQTSFNDPALDDGAYEYTVTSVDSSGNESSLSDTATTHVFSVSVQQPYSPVSVTSTKLSGSSARLGQVQISVGTIAGSINLDPSTTSNTGTITIDSLPLAVGYNHFSVRVTDSDFDISKAAEFWVDRGAVPAAPGGLTAVADDHVVALGWNLNSEADVLGYRVFRESKPALADAELGEVPSAASADISVPELFDKDHQTYWQATLPAGGDLGGSNPAVVLQWTQQRIVKVINLEWLSADFAAGFVDVDAWSGHAWIRIAERRESASAEQSIVLGTPYRTTMIRLTLLPNPVNPLPQSVALSEITLLEEPVSDAPNYSETLIDGNYHYQVSAVSLLAFESPLSAPVTVAVGDTQAPQAVTLTGSVLGNVATLIWSASSSTDTNRYELLRDGKLVASVSADTLQFIDSLLSLGNHAYIVVAYDASNNASEASNIVSLTVTGTVPGIPTQFSVVAPSQGAELDASWQVGSGPVPIGFVLRRAQSVDGPYATIATTAMTTYRDAPLTNGQIYFYTIEAIDAAGNTSGVSAPVSATPNDRVAPKSPILTYPTSFLTALSVDSRLAVVCGVAEAQANITLTAGSNQTVAAVANDHDALDISTTFDTIDHLLPAPDGNRIALVDGNGEIAIATLDSSQAQYSLGVQSRLQSWARNGSTLYNVDANSDAIFRSPLGQAAQQLTTAVSGIEQISVNANESGIALIGTAVDDQGNAVRGLWLAAPNDASARQVVGVDIDAIRSDYGLLWSPDGTKLLVVNGDYTASLVDISSLQETPAFEIDSYVKPSWNGEGSALVIARENDDEGDDLIAIDSATNSESLIAHYATYPTALAWSAGDDRIAVLSSESLDVISAVDGRSTLRSPFANVFGWYNLTWTPSGKIIVDNNHDVARFESKGWFCADQLRLEPGVNFVRASASDAVGNISLASRPIELDAPLEDLPELSIGAQDVNFSPPAGRVNSSYSLFVTVRNTGLKAAANPRVTAAMVLPDGSTRILNIAQAISYLAPAETATVNFPLGVLLETGRYTATATVDPDGDIDETDKTNNSASATLALTDSANPLLELSSDSNVYAPGTSVAGDVTVTATSEPFNGSLQVQILDSVGGEVADIGSFDIAALDFGQQFHRQFSWIPQPEILAGDYLLSAKLLDVGGNQLDQRESAFTIAAVRNVVLTLVPGSASASVGESIQLHADINFVAGNLLLENATARLSVSDSAGNLLWQNEQTLGILLPGSDSALDQYWDTHGALEGVYNLRLDLSAGEFTATTSASVVLQTSVTNPQITGSVVFDSGSVLIAGQSLGLTIDTANPGTVGLAAVQSRLRVLTADTSALDYENDQQFDLLPGQVHEQTLTFTAPPLTLSNHVAILESRLDSDPPGQWRLLAQQGFTVVDATPPEITVQAPLQQSIQPSLVSVRAAITDAHSSITTAELSLDAGEWQPFSAGADGVYARGIAGLTEGPHNATVRAEDSWGNVAVSSPVQFTVDATPPEIVISGVAEGDAVSHSVTPLIVVNDLHPGDSRAVLNGLAYTSGTQINTPDSYLLDVRAVDAAGNAATALVHFRIVAQTVPLTIVSPQDGDTEFDDKIAVIAQTSPGTAVTLIIGTFTQVVVAGDSGTVIFAEVPLAMGDNRINLSAIDSLGNPAEPVALQVNKLVAISGHFTSLPDAIGKDAVLETSILLDNASSIAKSNVGVEIDLYSTSDGALQLSDSFNLDIPAHQSTAKSRAIDTTQLLPGAYTIALRANVSIDPASPSYVLLDSETLSILPDSCTANGPVGDDEIFCNGFELNAHIDSTLSVIRRQPARASLDWASTLAVFIPRTLIHRVEQILMNAFRIRSINTGELGTLMNSASTRAPVQEVAAAELAVDFRFVDVSAPDAKAIGLKTSQPHRVDSLLEAVVEKSTLW